MGESPLTSRPLSAWKPPRSLDNNPSSTISLQQQQKPLPSRAHSQVPEAEQAPVAPHTTSGPHILPPHDGAHTQEQRQCTETVTNEGPALVHPQVSTVSVGEGLEDASHTQQMSTTIGQSQGKDPRLLKDSDVLEGDWLSVFNHSRDTSSYRVKCNSIRPEQYEDLLIFYMKVYQKRPTNMEVNVSFARAYVLQFSPRAVKAGRSVQFAWAIVGEEHNNDLKKSGHFHTHYLRWKVINGAGDSIIETVNVEEPNIELTPPPPIAPLASHSLYVQLTDDRSKEGKLIALIEDVQCRLTVAKDEHATCLKKLEAGIVHQLSDEKFGKELSLLDEHISATKLKLASIAEDDPVTRT
ncbi:hypothetical protein L7F22_021233 [Adiantum nelumboides]|nr:hypothetical protein [Adiantum nelumboides]